MTADNEKCVLVVGGGIGGISAALEVAEAGHRAVIVEKTPSLGGRVAGMHKYFPKLCPPTCGLEINYRRLKANPRVEVLVDAELAKLEGGPGDYTATVRVRPRMVNDKCTACNDCVAVCPVERPNVHNYGLDNTKAVYLPQRLAYPMKYAIDTSVCPGTSCAKCVDACKPGAIDLGMKEQTRTIRASAIVWATGWKPYDASRIQNLGFGRIKNVVTNVMFERMAATDGPTGGKIRRPSDGKEPKRVVFVQCAGSRDEEHLPYCSAVCCTASLKQVCYVREAYPDSKVEVFYIDLRVSGTNEDFLRRVQADSSVAFNKGKVGQILENPQTGDLTVVAEDVEGCTVKHVEADLVVLATGLVPEARDIDVPSQLVRDEYGFAAGDGAKAVDVAGCAKAPADVVTSVRAATAAGIRGIQLGARR